MKLSYFPQIKVVHTSKTFHGQLYVPLVNWLLMIGTVLVAAIYTNTTSLGDAYGVCVMFVTFFDSCMVTLAAIIVWRLNPFLVLPLWLTIACLDGAYLSSTLTKVPQGAWFTIVLSAILASIFILWRFGKEQQWQAEVEDRFPTSHLVTKSSNGDGKLVLTDRFGGGEVSKINGLGIFFDKAGETTPTVFTQFLSKLVAAPEVMVFFHLRGLETPTVAPEDRWTVTKLSIPNCYRLVARHGYADEVVTPDLAQLIFEQVRDFLINQNRTIMPGPTTIGMPAAPAPAARIPLERSDTHDRINVDGAMTTPAHPSTLEGGYAENEKDTVDDTSLPSSSEKGKETANARNASELIKLQRAFDHSVLYIIGKEQLTINPKGGVLRNVLLRAFVWIREHTRTKIANLRVPIDRVIEVGFVKVV